MTTPEEKITTSSRAATPCLLLALLLLPACHGEGRRAAPVCMAGDHRDFRGRCTNKTPLHRLPFRDGYKTQIMQGFHGAHSHDEDQPYAIDFLCNDGDPITATRDGVVWKVREDSLSGCSSISCDSDANFVVIDHGDGTYTGYHHLAPLGVIVEEGEQVCAGQTIGLCGVTGYTTGAHLHWELNDAAHKTIPARFKEIAARDGVGYPIPGGRYVSHNLSTMRCQETSYSDFPTDAFAHQGILLDDPLPRVYRKGSSRQRIRGVYNGDRTRVAIHRKPFGDEGVWRAECARLDSEGRFDLTIDWEDPMDMDGTHWFMITGADDKCESPGWAWSYRVRLDVPTALATPIQGPALPPGRDELKMPE